jgi:hypothetical protein
MAEALAQVNNFIHFILILTNFIVGVGFLLACGSSAKSVIPGFLWQTILLRVVAIIIFLCISYDFFRQGIFLLHYTQSIYDTISWHYILSRILLATALPIGLWITFYTRGTRVVNPAIESYVEQLMRETEEEMQRRQVFDNAAIKEAARRELEKRQAPEA